jgi:hypothetical protein
LFVQATASGLYIAEKIDLLVAYLIAQPLGNLLVKHFPQVSLVTRQSQQLPRLVWHMDNNMSSSSIVKS